MSNDEPTLSRMREESRQGLAHVLRLLGYPAEYATQLERQSYLQGKVWGWYSE